VTHYQGVVVLPPVEVVWYPTRARFLLAKQPQGGGIAIRLPFSEATMRVIPAGFASAPSRLAKTGPHFAFAVAYFLFALMLLSQIADVVIAILRAW
jgi:hypothetical protein